MGVLAMNGIPILMYHRVPRDPAERSAMAVPLADFEAQMAFLAARRIAVLTLSELVNFHRARTLPSRPSVVLTFDDGDLETCDNAEPVLDRFGFLATLFLITGEASGGRGQMGADGSLTWGRLRALRRFSLQAHSVSHRRLSLLSPAESGREIRDSKAAIEDGIGRRVDHFAYPFGGYTARLRAELGAAGFQSACAVHPGPAGLGDDLFRLHRVGIDGRDSPATFARKVRTGYGSVREQLISATRDQLFRIRALHDLAERRHALRSGRDAASPGGAIGSPLRV
jgi:peptidoglycan/xylan/chitin deacetylase (PgdA/CDA1 family)